MNKAFKKALSLILAMVMCLSVFSVPAFAAADTASLKGTVSGDTVNFEIKINASAAYDGAAFVIVYDDDVVEYDSVVAAGPFAEWGIDAATATVDGKKAVMLTGISFTDIPAGETVYGNVKFDILAAGKGADVLNKTTFKLDTTGVFNDKAALYTGFDNTNGASFSRSFEWSNYAADSVTLSYPNDNEGIKLAAPTVALTAADSTKGGLVVTITDNVNDASQVARYDVTLKDTKGKTVSISVNADSKTAPVPLTQVTAGEVYTATAIAVVKSGSDYVDSVASAPSAAVEANYGPIYFYDVDVTKGGGYDMKVGGKINVNLVEKGSLKGAKPAYTFAVTNGTLPAGLTLNETTGVISGTLTTATGNVNTIVTVTVTDARGETDTAEVTFGPVEKAGAVLNGVTNITKTYGDADFDLADYEGNFQIRPQAVYTYTVTSGADVIDLSGTKVSIKKAGTAVVTVTTADDNYNVPEKTFSITVNKSKVTIKPQAGQGKFFGTTDPAIKFDVVSGNVVGNELNGVLVRAAGETVGTYTYSLVANYANLFPNYTVTLQRNTEKFEIKKGAGEITDNNAANLIEKTYGDASFNLKEALNLNVEKIELFANTAYTYKVADTSIVTVDTNGNATIKGAGETTVTITATDSDYYIEDPLVVTVRVAKKDVTVTPDAGQYKVFDKAEPTLKWTAAGLVGTDKLTGITLTRAEGSEVGTYDYTFAIDATANRNYNVIPVTAGVTFEIRQASGEVTVTEKTYTKTYGDEPFFLTGLGIQTMAATTYSYDVTEGTDVISVAADGKVTIKGAGTAKVAVSAVNANYGEIEPYEYITVIVNKADLVITATTTSKTYGASDPELTYTVTGLQYSDTKEAVLGASLTREAGKNVGTYAFKLTAEPANYNYVINGKFEILPKELTVTASGADITKAYDGTTAVTLPEGLLTLNGVTPEDSVELSTAAVYANQYAGTKAIEFTTWKLTGTDAANYKLPAAPALMGGIVPAAQEITPDSITVTIGSTVDLTTKFAASGNGKLTFEGTSALFTVSGTTMTVNETIGTDSLDVSAAEVDLNGDGKAEFEKEEATVTIVVKDKEDVAVTMADASVNYDGKAHGLTASVPSGFTGTWTYKYTAADAIAVVPADGSAPVHAGKYTVTATFENDTHFGEATATLEIKPVAATVALSLNKTAIGFGDALPTVTYTVKVGRTVLDSSVVTVTPDFGGAETGKVGTYTVTADVAVNDTNYTVGTVSPAKLTITAKAVSTLEDDAVTIDGTVKQGETLKVVTTLPGAEVSATWKVNGKVVATGAEYTIPYGTMGTLECVITLGSNYSGTITERLGAISGMDVTAALTISPDTATDGDILTAAVAVTDPAGITDAGKYTVTWSVDGTTFATGNTVTLTTKQLGKTITAKAVSTAGNAYSFEAVDTIVIDAKAPVITRATVSAAATSATIRVTVDEMGAAATATAKIAKQDDTATVLETKDVVNGSVTFEGLETGAKYVVTIVAENSKGADTAEVAFVAKTSSGGGGGGSSKPKVEKPKEEEPKAEGPTVKPEMTVNSDAADVKDADAELTKDAISAVEVDVKETAASVPAPVELKVDLSGAEVKDGKNLTLVRYEKDENGNVSITKLGGTYDPATGVFTGIVLEDGTYGVVAVENLMEIVLQIDNKVVYNNDVPYTNDVAPQIVNDRTMVPLRLVAEAFGATVSWDEPTKTVTIVLGEQILKLTIGQPIPGFDTPAQIVKDRTMVPIRYISESFGADVTWVGATETIMIVK